MSDSVCDCNLSLVRQEKKRLLELIIISILKNHFLFSSLKGTLDKDAHEALGQLT